MRNLISFAVACLVVASVVVLPGSGVRAEVYSAGVGDDPGGVRGDDPRDGGGDDTSGVGKKKKPEAARPTVQIDTSYVGLDRNLARPDSIFILEFTFSDPVSGLTLNEIDITGASTISGLRAGENDSIYRVTILTDPDLEGDIVVTVPADAAVNSNSEGNVAKTARFAVDNKPPELVSATGFAQTITLTYHEHLEERFQADVGQFTVNVKRAATSTRDPITNQPNAIDVEEREVTLILKATDTIFAGDVVTLTYAGYSGTSTALREDRPAGPTGNHVLDFTDQPVRNGRGGLERPERITDLEAEAVDTSSIELTWGEPDDGGSSITGYRIEASPTGGDAGWVVLEANTGNSDTTYTHEGLNAGTRRFYRVAAINSVGTAVTSNVASATTNRAGRPPGRPTGLDATADGVNAIDLEWTAPTDPGTSAITGYRIQVSTDGGTTWNDRVTNTGNTNTSYKHTGLSANTTRHYRVYAINNTGESAASNTASATTGAVTTIPDPPTNLIATAQGQNRINLSWTAPADDGGSAITGYRIQWRPDASSTWRNLTTTGVTTTYANTGLDPATTRHYRVYAINAVGQSANPSNEASATTEAAAPGRPTGLTATPQGTSRVNLSWTAPADDGGSTVTGYLIEVSSDGRAYGTLEDEHPTTSYQHTGLNAGSTRYYRVSAINSVDTGPPSTVVSATTLDVPGPPRQLNATPVGHTQINLSWTAPASDGGSPVTGYGIRASSDAGQTWTELVGNTLSTTTSFSHTGLTAGTTWHYRVWAVNGIGAGPLSAVASTTTGATVPDPPTDLEATPVGRTRIDLDWETPAFNGGSAITGYRIEVSEDAGANWSRLEENTRSTRTRYADTGLSAGTTRHYRVSAINAVGVGEASNEHQATTAPNRPGPPRGLTAEATGMTSIDLSWSPPASDSGSAVTEYRIEVSRTGNSGWSPAGSATDTDFSHTGLTPDTRYFYRVRAVNSVGPGAPSNVARATTDPTVPDAPTNLTATADGPSGIKLTWRPPGYSGGSLVTGYRIDVSTDEGTTWTLLAEVNPNTIPPSHVHSGLTPGTTRHYRVSAVNDVGTGEASNVAHATTDAVVPASPTDLGATADGPFKIDLSWTAPNYDGGSPLTGYRIEVSTTRGVTWTTLVENTGSTSTAYPDEGLPAATRRDYRVSARNAVGASLPSNVVHATTDADVPDAPTDLTAMADGTSRIELEWTVPDYTGGVPISGYRIEVSEDGGSPWEVLEADTRSTSTDYVHTGLAPATTKHYRVRAINSADLVGDPSNKADATTDATTPGAPTDLTATADGTSRIDLAWTAPDFDGGAEVTGYRIEVSDDRGGAWTDLEADTESTTTTYAHTGLSPASTRHYRVSAINRVGAGDPSDVADATTDATVPDAPQRLTATAHDHERIDLAWEAPDFDGGSAITGYRIEVSENAGSTWSDLVANTGSAATEYSHTGLAPATTRHYRVSAINEIGTSERSNVANATTDAVVPDRPTDLVATATEPTRIDLEWSAPAYDGGAPISGYRIEVSEDGAAWTDLQRSTGSPLTTYAHIGLKPGSTRHYRVSAINRAGTGLPSNVASASTDDPVDRAGRVNEAILPHFAAAATSSSVAAISGRIEAVASRNPLRSQLDAAGLLSRAGNMGLRGSADDLDMGRLFNGESFALPLGGGGQQEDIATPFGFTTWGSAEYTSMGEPAGDEVEWDGDMLSIHIGADARVHRDILAGIAGSRSAGNYDFTDVTGEREVEGTYEARMTTVNPYVAWLPGRKGVSVWAAGSFGWGEVTVDDEPGGRRASDTRSRGGALGGGRIVHSRGASALRVRAEGWMSQVEVDGSEGMDTLTLDMQRLRVAVEWTQVQRLSGGQEVNLVAEGGLRYGDGDGTEGAGMEIGGGLRFVSGSKALTVEGHGRLLATSPNDYEEWGFRGLVQIEPQAVARGLSLKITPAWGQSASGVQELYEQGVGNRPDMGDALHRGRVNTRVEYGLGEFGGTPYGRFYLADGGARAFGTGMRYSVTRVLDLRFEGTRTESASGPVRHGLAMRGRWVF